jgi:hypothetical protein
MQTQHGRVGSFAVDAIPFLIAVGLIGFLTPARAESIQVWPIDPLVKVFRDAEPQPGGEAFAEAARGEYAAVQIIVRCSQPIRELHAELKFLDLQADPKQTLTNISVRFVGYVPVDRPIQDPPSDQLRKPPADFPDPLLEEQILNVAANEAQPIWITIPVPTAAQAGIYRGDVSIIGTVEGNKITVALPVSVKVYNVVLGKPRLWVTNWFSVEALQSKHMASAPKADSPEYWNLVRRYARKMAQHRQNVIMLSPLSLSIFRVGSNGELAVDFTNFDRWASIFIEEGVIGRIEGGHLGGRILGWDSGFVIQIKKNENNEIVSRTVDPLSPEADRFYAWFLPVFVNHLREKGWLGCYMQHLADEPTDFNVTSYRAMSDLIKKYAPQLKIIEACHTKDLVGAIDVWVPMLNYLHQDIETYRARQRSGDEVWFYTCWLPQGEYANRFIEQPLIKTRFLHWINFKFGLTGYLHWGYSSWRAQSPFAKTTVEQGGGEPYLAAGDAWIVYPGKNSLLDSIRYEAMRDGIDDHELLSMLADRDPAAAARLAAKHVLAFDKYNTDVSDFRATRRELLTLLSEPAKK